MTQGHRVLRRTALVTGASRGIGRAIAIALAARGVRIAVHYHNRAAEARQTAAELEGEGHVLCQADLADREATARVWNEVAAGFGNVDVVINNAGIYIEHPPLSTDLDRWAEAWRATLAANLQGPANLSLLAARTMAKQPERGDGSFGRGRIVNISSRGAFRGEPDAPAYGASKAGLNAMSQSMAKALAAARIFIYALAPGFVETDMAAEILAGPRGAAIVAEYPMGRVTTPAEVAQAAVFCALEAPPAMTGGIVDLNGASYLRM
jgi:NAD(P)-dependent dehydrogenase (short-subunit alcohol dehydrogenase family)